MLFLIFPQLYNVNRNVYIEHSQIFKQCGNTYMGKYR